MKWKLLNARLLSLSCVRRFYVSRTNFSHYVDEFSHVVNVAGYRSESHRVKTEDGYILKVHRVLPLNNLVQRGSVFLMHGLYRNSADFLASGPNNSLTYYLAKNGYDVWLGNARGTKYCTEHETLSYDSDDFWKFSFNEIGLYDIPAMINFMLDHRKEDRTVYVGHSQGCSSLLALLSSKPLFNAKIAQAHLMTPAVFMRNSTSPLLTMPLVRSKFVMNLFKDISKVDISSSLKLSHMLCYTRGYSPAMAMRIYKNFTCAMIGENSGEVEISEEGLRSFQQLMSPIVSSRQLLHFLQLHLSGKFQQFDFGDQNLLHYSSTQPIEYDLKKVTAPVHLYSASDDSLILPRDVEQLKNVLPNAITHETVQGWNHMDVMLGRNSRNVLYKRILSFMTEAL